MTNIPVRYDIDDGVSIPVRKTMPLRELKVGQSIEFPKQRRGSVNSVASRLKKETGMVFTVQTINENTCRIWRVE